MRRSLKLGDYIPFERYNAQNHLASAEAKGLNLELFINGFKAVKFLGDDATPALLPNSTVRFFSREWNDSLWCWEWYQVDESEADYYSMALINDQYWCFAPSYWSLVPQCPIMSFEEAEGIENKLLARAS
jgi:hypothetical protein